MVTKKGYFMSQLDGIGDNPDNEETDEDEDAFDVDFDPDNVMSDEGDS